MDDHKPRAVRSLRLHLASIGTSIPAAQVLDDPLLTALAVEDMCWRIAEDDWTARRPRRWQRRKLRRWYAEHDALRRQRDQLRALAGRCGIVGVWTTPSATWHAGPDARR